ncbi:RnfH family protein [Saccharobesus litoralis]|uniref:UPF0125 protein C2869_12685 n=1 Tax=Saccharobesus litoralis TaxID=2172099 RepID=A0A2S0VST7_9ALTE|nr:RnfH family protein [Saccharobesus litoralis]AWB67242.1 RnfH family protein [Saccharobesus litoralis]
MNMSQITIEVTFALPHKQTLLAISVNDGETIENCILQSGILREYPEIDLSVNKVGIWSRNKKLSDTVREGDRIEIYRPLIADPKEVRRRRAEKAKQEGRADKVTGGRVNPLRAKETD